MTPHDAWKLGVDDPHFDTAPEDPELPPVYYVDGVAKRTKDGKVIGDEEAEDLTQEWYDNRELEEILASEKHAAYLVYKGELK